MTSNCSAKIQFWKQKRNSLLALPHLHRTVAFGRILVGCDHRKDRQTLWSEIFGCRTTSQNTSCRFYNGPEKNHSFYKNIKNL